VTDAYVCRLLPLTSSRRSSDGRQPKGLRLAEMLGIGPLAWEEQRVSWDFSRNSRLGAYLVHRRIQVIHFGEDLVGAPGPDEGLGRLVVLGEVAVDRLIAAWSSTIERKTPRFILPIASAYPIGLMPCFTPVTTRNPRHRQSLREDLQARLRPAPPEARCGRRMAALDSCFKHYSEMQPHAPLGMRCQFLRARQPAACPINSSGTRDLWHSSQHRRLRSARH
jgi:hypothetical protein